MTTMLESAVQTGKLIEVELKNSAAIGVPFAALACPASTLSVADSPIYKAQLRGYSR